MAAAGRTFGPTRAAPGIMDEWTEYLKSGGQINVMYEDFEKAFDKISHK